MKMRREIFLLVVVYLSVGLNRALEGYVSASSYSQWMRNSTLLGREKKDGDLASLFENVIKIEGAYNYNMINGVEDPDEWMYTRLTSESVGYMYKMALNYASLYRSAKKTNPFFKSDALRKKLQSLFKLVQEKLLGNDFEGAVDTFFSYGYGQVPEEMLQEYEKLGLHILRTLKTKNSGLFATYQVPMQERMKKIRKTTLESE
jgi:hypothetical protein